MPLTLMQALEESFGLYTYELQHSRSVGGYLGTLHLVCSIPDICGALESDKGEASGTAYMAWADRHLVKGDTVMTSADWYKMRCSVLHQGSSLPVDQKGRTKSQYTSISFVTPELARDDVHRIVTVKPGGLNVTLGIPQLADEVLAALKDWFVWLHGTSPDAVDARSNLKRRLRTVVSPRPKMWPDLPLEGITWSSSGATHIITVDM